MNNVDKVSASLRLVVSFSLLTTSGIAQGAIKHRPEPSAPHHYRSAWLQARQSYLSCLSDLGPTLRNCPGEYLIATQMPLHASSKAEADALNAKLSKDCINEAITAGDVHACSKIDDENSDAISDKFLGKMQEHNGDGSIPRQVAEQVRRQYFTVASSGTPMDACVQAGIVAEAYLQANDEDNYRLWVQTREDDCRRAGLNR